MITTLRPNHINIDLQENKQPWLDYCKAHRITPRAASRQIVAKLTRGDPPAASPMAHVAMSKKVRVELRLTKEESSAASETARHEGFSLTRWVVALINARLYATPQLGQRELETLARSNMQMLAIGRNLNQLARAANAGVSITRAGGPGTIEALRAAVMRHAENVSSVIQSNASRWLSK